MTVPFERTRALINTMRFLQELMDPKITPRVRRAIRGKAKSLLKHYPSFADIEQAHKALPDTYGPVPPFSRLTGSPQAVMTIEASSHHDD
ncbi:BPSL0761 family protein [Polaromonas sp. C04]|uniref:BPSL0761 family protein n=1 Tax=Polaromonas sp. C04 TaxID=1945857 RepID=UPI0009849235|nr:BPSL0761 family protein [Polaromonas sp. C04]OOG58051.1 hypothetical protein B0E49_04270 [Polaromonas sp. C04]